MVFNTATIIGAVTPVIVSTFISHFVSGRSSPEKPTSYLTYDEGVALIRKFLNHASHSTVEELQQFTSRGTPHPYWVKTEQVLIPDQNLTLAAKYIQAQLGKHGIEKIGGNTWWQWRQLGNKMSAEWLEIREHYKERKKKNEKGNRVMFYVHGGGYFFGSVDEHRYQLQRHARKLKARIFAPRYRLAPQYPFPCGLYDCMAAYLYLITMQEPTTVVLAGDSAGGGMILSMMIIMRDQGIPLPAGAILISPWVDLTHSFPSVAADNPLDYLPPTGFHHKPSESWPPLSPDDFSCTKSISKNRNNSVQSLHENKNPSKQGNDEVENLRRNFETRPVNKLSNSSGNKFSVLANGNQIEIVDQIHLYTTNQLLLHPLVSPILQPSLGGLPPLLIMVGGAESLRDEQIYLAHKASNPSKYPPGDLFLSENDKKIIDRWEPTYVQLQVWEDMCHVAPTLSFARPVKYMYRSIAQFGSWALHRAGEKNNENKNEINDETQNESLNKREKILFSRVGKAGDALPPFENKMIRQKIDFRGNISHLEPECELIACNVNPSDIGSIKEGPLLRWLEMKQEWDRKYATAKLRVKKKRAREISKDYFVYEDGEIPPPSALAGRRNEKSDSEESTNPTESLGMSAWTRLGYTHDRKMVNKKVTKDNQVSTPTTRSITDRMNNYSQQMIDSIKGSAFTSYLYGRSNPKTKSKNEELDKMVVNPDVSSSNSRLLSIR